MKITKAVIPVAGLATRFLPTTKALPKEILPIGGFPVIHWVVKELAEAGIKKILFITNNRSQIIERYFAADPWLEDELVRQGKREYLRSLDRLLDQCRFYYAHQTRPAGIADALLIAEEFVSDEPFFCHMGDSFFCDSRICRKMIHSHETHGASCSVAVKEMNVDLVLKKAHVILEKEIENELYKFSQFIEKPIVQELAENLGVIGRFIFSPHIFKIIQSKAHGNELVHERDFSKLINALLQEGPGLAIKAKHETPFYDAGDLMEYSYAQVKFIMNENTDFAVTLRKMLA